MSSIFLALHWRRFEECCHGDAWDDRGCSEKLLDEVWGYYTDSTPTVLRYTTTSIFSSCRQHVGATLFVDKSGQLVRPSCALEVKDKLTSVPGFAWGTATLAYLYSPTWVI